MTYWLDLFTGATWREFLDAGGSVSGFSARRQAVVEKICPGDILLCYLTGVMRWVGALEVLGPSTDKSEIWKADSFPIRLAVKPLVTLSPENGVPMDVLLGKVEFFADKSMRGGYRGFLRGSPNRFRGPQDGELILEMLKAAIANPVSRKVDPRKLHRRSSYKVQLMQGERQVETEVTVPEPEEVTVPGDIEGTRHSEIQYTLATIGAEMSLDIWVASNDRSRVWKGKRLGDLPRMIDKLPTQFNEATTRTIELIDVLWLKRNTIVAAFEVECTTSIYSGLLRMSDLLALQPNLDIKLFLVASSERREKVAQEILRPTFSRFDKPLPTVCGFLAFDKLRETVEGIRKLGVASSLQPSFLDSIAEYFSGRRIP